jgi:hypothetical protein
MSIAVLHEVYTETRRLSVAGSVVAPGDFRLKKLVEPLKKAGERAPIFAKVAEYVEGVVGSNEKNAAEKLLDLTSLVCSILFTQGTTGVEGKLEDIVSSSVKTTKKQVSARMLKPLIEALTTKGSGRLEVIRSAIDLGLFSDLRLVRPALGAIDDVYGEIADLIAEKVLPTYGQAIYAELKTSFDPKGKSGHSRRMKLMHAIAPEASREVITESLSTGSAEVKIAAIQCLGDSSEDLSYLIEQSKAKAKDLRGAAYHALCKLPNPEALEVLVKAIDGKDTELVARSIGNQKPATLVAKSLERLKQQIPQLGSIKDKIKQGDAVSKVLDLLSIVENDVNAEVEKFTKDCFESSETINKIKSTPGGADIIDRVVLILRGASEASTRYLIERRDVLPVDLFAGLFEEALEKLKPKELFKIFVPYVYPKGAKKNTNEMRRHDAIIEELRSSQNRNWFWSTDASTKRPIEIGWLDLAIENDDIFTVIDLAEPKHPKSAKYLNDKRADKRLRDHEGDLELTAALIRIGQKDAADLVIDKLKSLIGKKGYTNHYGWINLTSRLDIETVPRLEELFSDPKLPKQWGDMLLDAINTIRENNPKRNE